MRTTSKPAAKQQKQSWFAKHKVLVIIIGVILLIAIIAAVSGGTSTDTNNNNNGSSNGSSKEEQKAIIGEAVRDGKFEFVVTGHECGVEQVGADVLDIRAQGQYCLINLRVTNIGDEPQMFFATNQKAFNAQGQEFTTDDRATLYVQPDTSNLSDTLNPGNSLEGTMVFDIPADQTITELELHDSSWSQGVRVELKAARE